MFVLTLLPDRLQIFDLTPPPAPKELYIKILCGLCVLSSQSVNILMIERKIHVIAVQIVKLNNLTMRLKILL